MGILSRGIGTMARWDFSILTSGFRDGSEPGEKQPVSCPSYHLFGDHHFLYVRGAFVDP